MPWDIPQTRMLRPPPPPDLPPPLPPPRPPPRPPLPPGAPKPFIGSVQFASHASDYAYWELFCNKTEGHCVHRKRLNTPWNQQQLNRRNSMKQFALQQIQNSLSRCMCAKAIQNNDTSISIGIATGFPESIDVLSKITSLKWKAIFLKEIRAVHDFFWGLFIIMSFCHFCFRYHV